MQVDHRRAAQGRRAVPRRRRGVPRDVRRRPHRRSAPAMIVRRSRRRGRSSCSLSCARTSTRTSSTPTPTGTVRASRTMNRSGVRINGGFFVMRRDILDWIEPGDEFVEETFEKLIAARRASAPTVTTASSARWTRSRTASGSRGCSSRARRRGCASGREAAEPRSRDARPAGPGREPLRRVLAIGATPTTSRSAAAGRILTLARRTRTLEVHWVVLAAHGDRADEARASAEAFLAMPASRTVDVHALPRRLPARTTAAEVKDAFEALKARVDPRPRPHPHTRRPPPGPPPRLRADVEHVPRPSDPRVRDPEVRRRPRPAQCVRRRWTTTSSTRKLELLEAHFGEPAGKDWFDDGVFRGLMRLRGMECRSPSGYAEGFTARKLSIAVGHSGTVGL